MLQKTDKLIMTVPEVARVFGKTGKAETATDSAPLEMVETTIQLKPQDQWRPGMTMEKIVEELDKTVRLPGLANLWVPPIRNRIDMLSTGIKSPIGIKVSGTNLADIDAIAGQIEVVTRSVPGVTSALAERLVGGRYLNIDIHREKAARYGMTVGDVQLFVSSAIGGAMVGETVEGVERYPINIRYPQSYRDSPETLRQLPILTPLKQQIVLGDVAEVKVVTGPSMLKTENARPTSWIYIDARDRDMVSVVHDLQQAIGKEVKLKPGISVSYSGQFELLERANQKLEADGADDANDYLRAAVSGVPPRRRSAADYHQRAVRPCGRDLVPLLDGVPSVGGHRYRLYRPRRGGGRIWRGDADVPAPRHRGGAIAGESADFQRR